MHFIFISRAFHIHLIFSLFPSPIYVATSGDFPKLGVPFRSQDGAVPVYIGLRAGRHRIGEDSDQAM